MPVAIEFSEALDAQLEELTGAGRIDLSNDVDNWLEGALAYPGVQTFGLSLPILLAATR